MIYIYYIITKQLFFTILYYNNEKINFRSNFNDIIRFVFN